MVTTRPWRSASPVVHFFREIVGVAEVTKEALR